MPDTPREELPGSSSASTEPFLGEIPIAPPVEEFRQHVEKRTRSFQGEDGAPLRARYERALKLGEDHLRALTGGGGRC